MVRPHFIRPFPRFVLATVIAMSGIGSGCGDVPQNDQTVVHFDVTSRDLGPIRLEAESSASFQLRNDSAAPVTIRTIKTSCGCVATDYDQAPVPVGGTRLITLTLTTRGQTALGRQVKHAWVQLDSGAATELVLRADVQADFGIEPRQLKFTSDQPTQTLKVTRGLLNEAEFGSVSLQADGAVYDVVPGSPMPQEKTFLVTLKTAAAGTLLPEIQLVNASDGRALPLGTVRCFREGPTLRPSAYVVVAMADPMSVKPVRFELVAFESEAAEITRVEVSDTDAQKYLKVDFDPAKDAKAFALSLDGIPDKALTSPTVSVLYRIGRGEGGGRLTLPCHIVVPPPAGPAE